MASAAIARRCDQHMTLKIQIISGGTNPNHQWWHRSKSSVVAQIQIISGGTDPNHQWWHRSKSSVVAQIQIISGGTDPNHQWWHRSKSSVVAQIQIISGGTDPNHQWWHRSKSSVVAQIQIISGGTDNYHCVPMHVLYALGIQRVEDDIHFSTNESPMKMYEVWQTLCIHVLTNNLPILPTSPFKPSLYQPPHHLTNHFHHSP